MSHKANRFQNLRRIALSLLAHQTLPQNELVRHTGLQPSLVSPLIRGLKDGGLIRQTGKTASGQKGGRPAHILELIEPPQSYGVLWIRPKEIVAYQLKIHGSIEQRETRALPCSLHDLLQRPWLCAQKELLLITSHPQQNPMLQSMLQEISSQHQIRIINQGNLITWGSYLWKGGYQQSVLGIHLQKEPFTMCAGMVDSQGEFLSGAHQQAGQLIPPEPIPPYPFNGSDHGIRIWMQRISQTLLMVASFIDPAQMILTGNLLELPAHHLLPIQNDLAAKLKPIQMDVWPESDPVLRAAAWYAWLPDLEKRLLQI